MNIIIIEVKAMPGASKQRIIKDASGTLKCYLISPPEKGKANQELINLLADKLSIKKSAIEILSGGTTQKKRISIQSNFSKEEIYSKLGVEPGGQYAIF